MGNEPLNGVAPHADELRVHLVVGYLLALHGLERSGPYVQRQLLALNAALVNVVQHAVSKV